MIRFRVVLLAVIFTLSAWPASILYAQEGSLNQENEPGSHVRIVRLSYLQGSVELDNNQGYQNATTNVPITEGDRLLTRADGWAEVQFEDGSTLRLAPDTELTFSQLGRDSEGGTLTAIDLDQGETEFRLKKHDQGEFAVTARQKTILLKHSGRFRVTTTNADPLEVTVFKGEVGISDSLGHPEIGVKKNETFALDELDPSKYDLEKEARTDELDRWGDQREQALSSYASAENYTQSPYQYGVNDLGYYGTYYNVPGYGYMWQPNGVTLGWDPYMNGYWIYSPAYGYSWVSAYPWGWMPYRYGNWVFVNGYGWLWQPGGWNYWNTRPFLRNTPPGFHPPIPPATQVAGGQPGAVRMGTLPERVEPRDRGGKPAFGGGSEQVPKIDSEQVPRIDVERNNRGHRVFSNEQPERRAPQVDNSTPQPSGVVRMERRENGEKVEHRATRPDEATAERGDNGAKTPRATENTPSSRGSGVVMRSEPRPEAAPIPAPAPAPAPRAAPAPPASHPAPPPASAAAPRMQPAPSRPSFSSSGSGSSSTSSSPGKPK